MKRFLLTAVAVLALLAGLAQQQDRLPMTVQHFLHEQATISSYKQRIGQGDNAIDIQRRFSPPREINGQMMVDAFIDIQHPGIIPVLRSNGVIVNCEFDGFVTSQIPLDQLTRVCRIPGVINVEVSRLVELCTDTTMLATHVSQTLNGQELGLPMSYKGDGVIIGLVDFGFDYQHIAFKRDDGSGKSRIVRVYDPDNETGHPALVGETVLPGSVFMDEQIDTLTTDCNSTHGTHTASIAAGTHIEGYGGMAPGADIVLCTSRTISSYINELQIINSIKYIYTYADSVGKPCVISFSVSTRQGGHDGNDRVSKAIAQSVGPGRIFVVAAGNNGTTDLYSHGVANAEKPFNLLMGYIYSNADESYYYVNTFVDIWVRKTNLRPIIKFHILDKMSNKIVWESELISLYKTIKSTEISDYFEPNERISDDGHMYGIVSLNPTNGKYCASCEIKNLRAKHYYVDNDGMIVSRYQIGVSVYPPSVKYTNQPDSCYLDAWVGSSNGRLCYYNQAVYKNVIGENGDTTVVSVDNFYATPSDECSIGGYAVNDSVISAGSYVGHCSVSSLYLDTVLIDKSVTVGKPSPLTSYQLEGVGPTGKALPTVTAPGYLVVAAGSHYSYFATNLSYPWTVKQSADGSYWGAMSGTSMAAPTVAGIIAQWLQIDPALSPSDIKRIIAATAIKDQWTQNPVTGFRFGPNGKIDALAGVRYLLGIDDFVPGDVNGNGEVSIKDVTLLIDYLLGAEDEDFVPLAADVNQDGHINIKDVTLLIDMLLGNRE